MLLNYIHYSSTEFRDDGLSSFCQEMCLMYEENYLIVIYIKETNVISINMFPIMLLYYNPISWNHI